MNDDYVEWLNRPVSEMSDFDVEDLLGDTETSIHVVNGGETVFAPPPDTVSTSRVRARSVGGYSPMIEVKFTTTFMITEETIPEDEDKTDNESDVEATSPDWGLSESLDDDNTSEVD